MVSYTVGFLHVILVICVLFFEILSVLNLGKKVNVTGGNKGKITGNKLTNKKHQVILIGILPFYHYKSTYFYNIVCFESYVYNMY